MLATTTLRIASMSTNIALRQSGLTLVEMALSLAIISLLAAISLPASQDLQASMKIRAAVSTITTDFALARTTAVSKNSMVVVCPNRSDKCEPGHAWTTGWMAFIDANRNQQADQGEEILTQHGPLHPSLRLSGSQGRPNLRYLPDGRSAGSNMTLNLCDSRHLRARIIVNNVGRVRSERIDSELPCPV